MGRLVIYWETADNLLTVHALFLGAAEGVLDFNMHLEWLLALAACVHLHVHRPWYISSTCKVLTTVPSRYQNLLTCGGGT